MANNLFSKQMANREVADMIFQDYKTKKPFLYVDYANTSSQELTGETVYAYGGKGHPKKVSFSGDKGGTLTIETQIQTPKLWEMMSGGTGSTTANVMKKVNATIGSTNTITLDTEDTLTQGQVWVYDATDTNLETELEVTSVSDQTITLTSGTENDPVIVFYTTKKTDVYNINIKATSFPRAFTVYGDTYMKTTDDDILPYLFKAYKAVPQPTMSLAFSNNGDPATVTITCDLLVDDDGNLLDLTLLPEETEGE
nr:MAG TPA: structural protein [Caudoviricetes sp.]